jgi:hypothetical protein
MAEDAFMTSACPIHLTLKAYQRSWIRQLEFAANVEVNKLAAQNASRRANRPIAPWAKASLIIRYLLLGSQLARPVTK